MRIKGLCCYFMSLLFVWGFHPAFAQPGKLPPFRIVQPGGKILKAENLPFEKPILVIYFSPDCDHCQAFMNDFFKKISSFKKASIAMITFVQVEKVQKFMNDYKVNKYPNIVAGTEGTTFFLRNYYKINDIPFVALYDKNGNLISSYQHEIPVNDLAKKLEKLK